MISAMLAITALPPIVGENLAWWVGGLVILLGLGVYGFRDVRRFSVRCVWAVADVAFKESIRRKVLWITPVAMLSILGLSLIIQAVDPADAIRQLNKFCYFASGVTVVLTAIVLSCTNLPRDMESKVIFTVVTKPATRLELVLGKIVGFGLTSAVMLLIMLAFTLAFVSAAATVHQRSIGAELEAGPEVSRQAVLNHYATVGLLASRTMVEPVDLQFYGQLPSTDPADPRVMSGGNSDAIAPFIYDPLDWIPPDAPDAEPGSAGGFVSLRAAWSPKVGDAETAPAPTMIVSFLDQYGFTLVSPQALKGNGRVRLAGPAGEERVFYPLTVDDVSKITALPPGTPFFVKVDGGDGYQISLPPDAVQIFIPQLAEAAEDADLNANLVRSTNERFASESASFRPLGPIVRGRPGRLGQQLVADDNFKAVFRFQDVDQADLVDGGLPIEMRVGVQRSGEVEDAADVTVMSASFRNRTTGEVTGETLVYPETNQPLFFAAPAQAVDGGAFDLLLENRTPGNVVEFGDFSVAVVTGREPYLYNLAKGFTALWLLSVLVSTVGVFASTFVSWPIAIVVTLCLLLSRWAVDQLSDIMQPGFGQKVAGDIFSDGTGTEAAVTQSAAEWLTKLTVSFASLLPDLGKFDAARWIEAGQSVPLSMLGQSALLVLVFATPLLVLAYVRLRTKEVAV